MVNKKTGKIMWIKLEFNAHLERKCEDRRHQKNMSTDRRLLPTVERLLGITRRDLSTHFK